jgi:hypothetical protein
MTETDIWTKWESQTVNGLFPLRRFLGRSDHSVVFLTDCEARNISQAAIKLIPADPATAEAQLSQWKRIAALSHPNLVRVLDSGRCTLGGHPFLFIVMEYAEQTLAEILRHRALTFEEVREMLIPTLAALGFLHRQNLVQSRLKPQNFLVVNDQLKLASDNVRPIGDRGAREAQASPYDAPEAKNGTVGGAGDVWSLGISIVEALTQSPPAPGEESEAVLPVNLPAEFVGTVRGCLKRDPSARPTIAALEAQFSPAPAEIAPPVTLSPIPHSVALESARPTPRRGPRKKSMLIPAIAASTIIVAAIWAGIHQFRKHASTAPLAESIVPAAMPPAAPPVAVQNPAAAMSAASSVLHQEIPVVSRGARNSIRGQIKVSVLVTVDRSGNVVAESLQNHGSSKFFARLASDAAKEWRFVPADSQDSRQWLLRFEFSRNGAAGQALPHGPGVPN